MRFVPRRPNRPVRHWECGRECPAPGPFRVRLQQPIRRRLPLLITTLLCIVVTAISWLGYEQLEKVLLDAARDRAVNSATRLSGSLVGSIWRIRREALAMASAPAVAGYAAGTRSLASGRPDSILRTGISATSQVTGRTLWSRHREPLVTAGERFPLPLSGGDTKTSFPISPAWTAKEQSVSALRFVEGRVLYDVVSPVVTSSNDTVGTLVETRRIGGGSSSQLLSGFAGPDGQLLLGNAAGSLWTDLSHVLPGPPVPQSGHLPAIHDTRAALGVITDVPTTPWLVSISIPTKAAIAPARRFLLRAGLIAFALVLLGAIAAWWLSRSITRPLDAVSHAAAGIASGDYARRAAVHRVDELGRLATSFNTMAERIATASLELQTRAAESEASATLLDVILASAPIGFALLDRDLRYLRVNDALARLNGVPASAHAGRFAAELQPELDEEQVRSLRGMLDGGVAVADAELVRHEATCPPRTRHLRASFFPVSVGGDRPLGVGMFVLDTTDRRGLEAQLQQSQRMEAVGQLAGGIAHDFNNLLTVITSYSAMLLADLPANAPHGTDVREIMAASNRAATLTRQLLAFSRQQVLQPRVIDLNALTTNLEKMLRRLLREDIELTTTLESTPRLVSADPGQIEQVVMNLVVNARDAMPEGGRIRLATSSIDVDEQNGAAHAGATPGPYTVLTVDDTGHGMDDETMARIFEPFFTTKPLGQGTGLGLSTVYGIVKQSGGYVTVHSKVGHGTSFRVYLPSVVGPAMAGTEVEHTRGGDAGSALVLLVEDEATVRSIARRILERDGYRVVEAANGVEAVQIMEQQHEPISLVLTDLVMPEMGGRELAAHVRNVSPSSRVLFMSGYTEDAILRRSAVEPGTLFLHKPFTLETLRDKVREALSAA